MKKKVLKKCTSLLIALTLLISLAVPVYAEDNSIKVQLNGENISFDVAPQMLNNRIMVPMRTIFEKLGANVEYDSQTGAITATKDDTVIKLSVDSPDAVIAKNGVESTLQMDTASTVVNGRTLVPVRFISESLGKQVGWDAANRTVVIIDYAYFLNALKTQAPAFYEFASTQYGVVNTGEINSSVDVAFKYNSSTDSTENVSGTVNTNINAKINEENGSMDAVIKVTGLEDVLNRLGLANADTASFNIRFDNNSFYVKSNLASLMEQYNISPLGDKWMKVDIADLNIPDVKTLQDLKTLQSQQSSEQVLDSLANTPMELDVNSFAEAQSIFNAFVTLVDNNHFTVANQGDMKVYTWNIGKQDLVDLVLKIQKTSGDFDMTLEELAEMKKFVDSLVFDFNMVVGVKNNIVVSSKSTLNMQMDIPEVGYFELSLKSNSEVLNPNNAHFEITMPDPSNVVDYKDLVPDNSEEISDIY